MPCHGDLWASHVLFDGQKFSGLVDFEGLHFAPSVADLAQLILHFSGWTSREMVLDEYESISPLEEGDRSLLYSVAARTSRRKAPGRSACSTVAGETSHRHSQEPTQPTSTRCSGRLR